MKIAKPLQDVIDSFRRLPGIGPKTAQRLTYYLLHVPQTEIDLFAQALSGLKKKTLLCSICKNVSDREPCPICADRARDTSTIMVVEQPLDVIAFERTGKFSGVYHVLHGAINPLENIGPDEIFIDDLINRLRNKDKKSNGVDELILAMNPNMEGEATAMYISKKVREQQSNKAKVLITRIGMGMPTGADVEYADEVTLSQALEGRKKFE